MAKYSIDFYDLDGPGNESGPSTYGAAQTGDFATSSFTAQPLDYDKVQLDWASVGGSWGQLRVVRSTLGYPAFETDGVVLFTDGASARGSFTDTDLPGGVVHYYSLFVDSTEVGSTGWVRVEVVATVTRADHGHRELLAERLLPDHYVEADEAQGNPLRRFLELPALVLDQIRSEAETLRRPRDLGRVHADLLPLIASEYGTTYGPSVGAALARRFVRDAVYLHRRRGSAQGIRALTTALVGWPSTLSFVPDPATPSDPASPPQNRLDITLHADRLNLVTNPSFEVNTAGWSAGTATTMARSTASAHTGTASLQAKPARTDGYGGTTSASNDTSPLLIDLAQWGVSQIAYFPNSGAGNHLSTPDDNILLANEAHGTALRWEEAAWTTSVVSMSVATRAGYFGQAVRAEVTTAGDAASFIRNSQRADPVTAGQTVTFAADVESSVTGRSAYVILVWRDSGGAQTTTSGGLVALTVGTRTRIHATATVPATSVSVEPRIVFSGATTVGDVYHFGNPVLRVGSSTTFVPSHNVTGDIDMKAKVVITDLAPSSNKAILSKFDDSGNQGSWLLWVSTSGALQFIWREDGTATTQKSATSTVTLASAGITERTPVWLRAALDVDNGAGGWSVAFYSSTDNVTWTQIGATVTVATVTSIFNSTAPVRVGNYSTSSSGCFNGAIFSAEVRDGLNGNVIANPVFTDTTAFPGGMACTGGTDAAGNTWALGRATNDYAAEIIDRTTWAFGGVHQLDFPDADHLEGGFGDFSLAIRARASLPRSSGSTGFLWAKRGGARPAGETFLSMVQTASGVMEPAWLSDSITSYSGGMALTPGTWHTWGQNYDRDGDRLQYRDGTAGTGVSIAADNGKNVYNSDKVAVGASSSNGSRWGGQVDWAAFFKRLLTAAEHTELANWNGSIATEPAWLRAAASWYININDPSAMVEYRTNNTVMNLAGGRTVRVHTPDANGYVGAVYGTSAYGSERTYGEAPPEGDPANLPFTRASVNPLDQYCAQARIASSAALPDAAATLTVHWYDDAGAEVGTDKTSVTGLTTSYQHLALETRAPNTATSVALTIAARGLGHDQAVYVDSVLLEHGAGVREYFDGDSGGADYMWEGTAHASRSHHYFRRTTKNARLTQVLPTYLPWDVSYSLLYAQPA